MRHIAPLAVIITFLSCNKNDNQSNPYPNPPTVVKVETSSEMTGAVAHPKFTITLNVPDTNAVNQFMIIPKGGSLPSIILKPKTGTYVIVDTYSKYPLPEGANIYTPSFIMSDNKTIYLTPFNAY